MCDSFFTLILRAVWFLACAERADGGDDIQVVFELPMRVAGSSTRMQSGKCFSTCLLAQGIEHLLRTAKGLTRELTRLHR
jgi:hypothetical protein